MEIKLGQILEASLHELQDFRRAKTLSPELKAYALILITYLKGDSEALRKALDEILSSNPELSKEMHIIHEAGLLRFQIRNHMVDPEHLKMVEELANSASTPIEWRAELFFIIAMSYETLHDDQTACGFYKHASVIFDEAAVHKKAIKAYQNYIASESRVHHEKNFLVEYQYVYEKARKLGELGVAGSALNNMSHEYQKTGSLKLALKFSNRALACLKKDFGSLHYYLALAHRAHLLIEMGNEHEARITIDQLKPSTFAEVRAALEELEELLDKAGGAGDAHSEDFLIRLLMLRERDKFELMELLWGEDIGFTVGEERLRELLVGVRKKYPGLIACNAEKYRIASPSLLPKAYLKKSG